MNNTPRKRLIERVRKRLLMRIAAAVALLGVITLVGAAAFVAWGVYNVSALEQHTGPVYHLLTTALDRSVRQRAEALDPPPLTDPALVARGLRLYQDHCVQCHGAPGVARDAVGRGMTPVPPNLVHTARNKPPANIFWAIKHGIKMTGMPSWRFQLSDQDIWAIVAFVDVRMPELTPAGYRAYSDRIAAAGKAMPAQEPTPAAPADPERGKQALYGYACTACHRIPGLVGPQADVGPPLAGIGERRYIAGVLSNNADNMALWIRDPDGVDPLTAMPDLDVTEQDARDMAAYLRTLK